jgi:signal transduction histidine kinase
MSSIRGRLLLWQISALMLTGLLVSIITYLLAWDAFNKIRDYGLEQIAYSVVRHGVQYDNDEEVRNDRGQFVSQIWTADNSLFFSSIDDAGPPKQSPGQHVLEWQGTEWRIFTLQEGGMTIQVATTSASRARKFAAIAPWLLLPLVVLVVVLGLLIRAAVGRALAPLEQVRTEVSQRSVSSLHALDMHNMPDEVAQNEREFALAQLTGGVDRAAHLVEQLLHMARLEPSARQGAFQTLSLDTLIKKVVADFSTQAEARDIDLGVSACASINITGQADSLRMLLGNLLDNALRYSPTGGRVDVELGKEDNQAVISVYDSGPGIPETERERVFERFYRVAGSDVPGSGLGLSIVRQVAVLHGGHIELNTAKTGGLAVRVVLPLRC